MVSSEKLYGSKYVEQTTIRKIYIQTVQHFYKQTVHHANPKCGTDCGTDCGAENGTLAALQCALVGSTDAHRYGSSPLNQ